MKGLSETSGRPSQWASLALGLAALCSACTTEANGVEVSADGGARSEAVPVAAATAAQVAADPTPAPRIVTQAIDQVAVELVEPGQDPAPLTLEPVQAGTTQRLVVTQGGSIGYTIAAEAFDLPAPELAITLTVTAAEEVTPGEPTNARAEVAGFNVTSRGAEDDSVDYARNLLKGLPGPANVTVDGNRRLIGPTLALPGGEPGELLVLGYVDRRLTTLADPLPSEPFGVGAVWEARRSSTIEGFPVAIVDRYTATVVSPTEVRADLRRTVRFRSGTHESGEILDDSVLSGTGEVVWSGGAPLGVVDYDLSGTIRYRLGGQITLVQDISRSISTTSELSVPPTSETTTTTDPTTTDSTTDPSTTGPTTTGPSTTGPATTGGPTTPVPTTTSPPTTSAPTTTTTTAPPTTTTTRSGWPPPWWPFSATADGQADTEG